MFRWSLSMRVLFGAVSLLIVLAVVGLLAVRQLRAVSAPTAQALPAASGIAPPAATGTVREQSQQLQKQVASDVAKALEQGAAARNDEAAK